MRQLTRRSRNKIPILLTSPASATFESRWLGADSQGGRLWLEALPPGAVIALLLMEGPARLQWPGAGTWRDVAANSLLWFNTSQVRPDGWQHSPALAHEALMLVYPVAWVHETLASLKQEMAPDFQGLLLGPQPAHPLITRPLEAEDRAWSRSLMAPTLCAGARQLLEGSRMSEFFFRKVLTEARGEELFCTRTRRLALERVGKVRAALLENLEEPPGLNELARLCACNPQYLSRTFSETAGTTISLYLRRLRIERAAELLRSGRMNASEAALEVGYRSLSHFSQAFRQEKGHTPSEWVRGGAVQPTARRAALATNARQFST